MSVATYSYKQNKKLSPHFHSNEFASKDGNRLYSDNVLIDSYLIEILEKVFAHFDLKYLIINSGYRTPSHDIAVGGNGRGMHTLGKAADFKCKKKDGSFVESKYICCYLEDLGVHGIGKINSRSVHVDTREKENKWFGDEENGRTCVSWYDYFGISDNEYFDIPKLKTNSITDALKSIGEESNFSSRKKIAKTNGFPDYTGKAAENSFLLELLMKGKLKKSN